MAGIIETMSSKILAVTTQWADIPNTIIGWVTPIILLGLTISIMWQGYKIVRGAGGQNHLLDVFFNSTRTFLVVSLCLVAGTYATNVVGVLHELRDELAGLFTGGTPNIYASLDGVCGQVVAAYKEIWNWGADHTSIGLTSTDLSGLTAIIGGGLMAFFVIVYCVVAAINMIFIDFSLAVLFAVGPLFVACLAFQSTTSFFNTWFSAALKYVFTAIAISAVVGLGTGLMQNFASALTAQVPATTDYISMTFSSLVAGIVLVVLTTKAAHIGADLAGGAAVHIASLAEAKGWVPNPVGAAASAAGNLVGAGVGQVAGRATAAAANTAVGQAIGGSSAMRYAMAGLNAMSNLGGGARAAMSERSAFSAMRAGFQSGSSVARGMGTISK